MSNLQFPYSTAEQYLKPKYSIENTTDLKIKSNNINFFDNPELSKIVFNVSVPMPSDIDMLIEEHENPKNAVKCVIQIISRQSINRKEIILENYGSEYKGTFEILKKEFVDTTSLKTLIIRDKSLTKKKSKFIASDKGAILAYAEKDLIINFKKNEFTRGMPIQWVDFTNPNLNIDEYFHETLYFLEIDGPENYPVFYFNEKYKSTAIAEIIKTEDKNNPKFRNKELLHSFIYDRTMTKLLSYVLFQLEKQKNKKYDDFSDEEKVSIDNLETKWQKDLLFNFANEFIPGASNLEDAVSVIEKTINDGNVNTLIQKIDLVIQMKKQIHKKITNYYDNFLESFYKNTKEDEND